MSNTATFLSATSMLPAGPNLAEALAFYTKQLGFTIAWQSGSGAGVRRGNVEFNLVENDNREWADNCSVSIGVDDLDALYEEYKSIAARVGPLEVKPWGPPGVPHDYSVRRVLAVLPATALNSNQGARESWQSV